MGRINPNEAEKYERGQGEWFKLSNDGDVARVQFLYNSPDELDIFACHEVDVNGSSRYVSCNREYDEPMGNCPFCVEQGLPKPVTILSMFDVESQTVKSWVRGKTFRKKIENLFNRYPMLRNTVVEIERNGAKGDTRTTYEIYPMPDIVPTDISDIEKPEFLGGFILEKTNDDMDYYNQHGEFPKDKSAENTSTRRSRRAGY